MKKFLIFSLYFLTLNVNAVPIKDNLLFGFEKCKDLSVDLEKGQLKEAVSSSIDIHCAKKEKSSTEFICRYFAPGSNKKIKEEIFKGESELGLGELRNTDGKTIRFLIGKNFASFESGPELKVCAGIFIFEKDALKQKASSLKSGL